jgi:hypothetical protein
MLGTGINIFSKQQKNKNKKKCMSDSEGYSDESEEEQEPQNPQVPQGAPKRPLEAEIPDVGIDASRAPPQEEGPPGKKNKTEAPQQDSPLQDDDETLAIARAAETLYRTIELFPDKAGPLVKLLAPKGFDHMSRREINNLLRRVLMRVRTINASGFIQNGFLGGTSVLEAALTRMGIDVSGLTVSAEENVVLKNCIMELQLEDDYSFASPLERLAYTMGLLVAQQAHVNATVKELEEKKKKEEEEKKKKEEEEKKKKEEEEKKQQEETNKT